MNLANNIQLMRKKNFWSQEELAEKCSVSRQAVAKWENGESVPNVEKLILLADIFNVSLDEIVGRKSVDDYERFKQYVIAYKADDIQEGPEGDVSAIVSRYLLFAERMGLSAKDKLNGLEEIFLSSCKDN